MITSKEKLKCRKFKSVLRYHQPSPHKNVEQYAHHLLFAFYPFRQEEELKCTVKGIYFAKLQAPVVLNIINRNKSVRNHIVIWSKKPYQIYILSW